MDLVPDFRVDEIAAEWIYKIKTSVLSSYSADKSSQIAASEGFVPVGRPGYGRNVNEFVSHQSFTSDFSIRSGWHLNSALVEERVAQNHNSAGKRNVESCHLPEEHNCVAETTGFDRPKQSSRGFSSFPRDAALYAGSCRYERGRPDSLELPLRAGKEGLSEKLCRDSSRNDMVSNKNLKQFDANALGMFNMQASYGSKLLGTYLLNSHDVSLSEMSSTSFDERPPLKMAHYEDLESTENKENISKLALRSVKYGKRCPQCHEINDEDANWCLECGKAIVSVEVRKVETLPKQHKMQCKIEYSLLDYENCLEEKVISADRSLPVVVPSDYSVPAANSSLHFPVPKNQLGFDYDLTKFKSSDLVAGSLLNVEQVMPPPRQVAGSAKSDAVSRSRISLSLPDSIEQRYYSMPYAFQNSWSKKGKDENGSDRVAQCVMLSSSQFSPSEIASKANKALFGDSEARISVTERESSGYASFVSQADHHESLKAPGHSPVDEPSPNLCLPDEILLQVFSYLAVSQLARCARVCRQFSRVALDQSLWSEISVKKKFELTDDILHKIATKHPAKLVMSQCSGKRLTSDGLIDLFQSCSNSLQELDISGSSGGVLIGESILLHLTSSQCNKIRSIDVSWTNVEDVGLQAIINCSDRLEAVRMNGCQMLTDDSVQCLASKHCKSLLVLEIFGCFNVSPVSFNALASACTGLRTLHLGQCHKVSNGAVVSLATNLTHLESLDLRGCKQVGDQAVKAVAEHCLKLETLILANCPFITDSALVAISSSLSKLRLLDVCGCGKITDKGVQTLAKGCNRLATLDLSSTKISQKSLASLANYCRLTLVSLKLSFCHDIGEGSLVSLVRKCQKLETLHLYGCKRLRNGVYKLLAVNNRLKIEKENHPF